MRRDTLQEIRLLEAPAQFGVICKRAEGALSSTVFVIDGDIKQPWLSSF